MGSQTIRVLLVDDHSMVREGIRILLNEFEDIRVAGEAADGVTAIELVEQLEPDVIVMDLTMPVMDGLEAMQKIIALRPDQRIIVLTGYLDDERLFQAIQMGALGCVDKTIEPEALVQAIRDVSLGRPSLSSSAAWRVLRGMTESGAPRKSNPRLSNREVQILRLLSLGKLDKEIAQELVLSEVTIRTHISRILFKLGLENRVQAALYGHRSGLVSIAETADLFDARWR